MSKELFVGITAYNSARFLDACLHSLRATTDARRTEIVVLDNASDDDTVQIARRHGVRVVVRACTQANALNWLFRRSRARYTLLLHADVVMMSPDWLRVCTRHFAGTTALVSPQDVGLGPHTRGYADKPESSFMLFDTVLARRALRWYRTQRFKIKWPWRGLNFYGPHVTHELPDDLQRAGLTWQPMEVVTSPRVEQPIYSCGFEAPNWRPEYAMYQYGFGNFYRLDGVITHYHNWYDRVDRVPIESTAVHPTDLLPLAFFRAYGEKFLQDYKRGEVRVPQ